MQNTNQTKKGTVIAITALIYAALAILLLVIVNNDKISEWFHDFTAVLAPIIIGFVIAALCNPVLTLFEKKLLFKITSPKLRRVISMILTYIIIFALIFVCFLIVIPQLNNSYQSFINNLNSYTEKAITLANKVIYKLNKLSDKFQVTSYIDLSDVQNKVSELLTSSSNTLSTIANYVVSYAKSIAIGVKNTLFGLFFSIYILASKEWIIAKAKRLCATIFNENRYLSICNWSKFTVNTFGNYIKAEIIDALIVAVMTAITFGITGMPFAILLSFIIGVTNIIPVFGPFIGAIPVCFIVLISAPEKVILCALLILIIQQIDGNLMKPLLFGSTLGMSSFGVLCSITIMGGYFGIIGMLLGVPFFVVIGEIIKKLVCGKLETKQMPLALADYYPNGRDMLTESDEKKDGIFMKLVHLITRVAGFIFDKIKRIFKRK